MKIKQTSPQKSKLRLGVFSGGFSGNYQLKLISGIEEAARRLNVQVIYFVGRALQSPYPYEKKYNIVYNMAKHASIDGLIVFSLLANYCKDAVLTKFLTRYKNIPIVTINLRSSAGNAILSNNTPGFSALMKHLIEEHQYRKLAFVKGPEHNLDAQERFYIYKGALSSAGIPFNPALVTGGNYRYKSGQKAARHFLNHRRLKPGRDMEVVICANDAMACGIIDEFYDLGINVPGDIGVTGFDNIGGSFFPKPHLTTVNQHLHEIGSSAVYSLLDYKPHKAPLLFDTELVISHSCGCPQGTEKQDKWTSKKQRERPSIIQGPVLLKESPHYLQRTRHKKYQETIFYKIISIIDNLKILQKMTEFTAWMKSDFPELGINCAWILLTSSVFSGDRTYKCIGGFDLQVPGGKKLNKVFKENQILPGLLSEKLNRSLCILPLMFKEEKYGFLIIEVKEMAYLLYDSLSHQIGSSIKHLLLSEKVTAMNQQLKLANEQKTQFFINIAHEIKTPLTLIQNYLDGYMEINKSDENLLVIKQNFDLLLANMLNYLDVEKLLKGHTIYQHQSLVDLSMSVQKKCTIFQAMAKKKKIQLTYNVEDRIIIRIDPLALDRLLNNILDNAVKYTQEEGEVHVDAWNEGDKSILRINDNGPGLPVKTFEHIFEPYYLLSRKKTRGQGVGVGLSIIKKIIDEIGAAIEVEERKGGGTSFIFTFDNYSTVGNQKMIQQIPDTIQIKTPGKIKEKKISPDKLTLLIVDDNVQLLKFMQTSLSETYNVYLSQSTDDALIKLELMPRPDLIISDVMMDGPDGFQLLRSLSEKERYSEIPFIFLTALKREKEKIKGLKLGAVDYIEKPFSIAALKAKIDSIITLRQKQAKLDIRRFRKKLDTLFTDSDISISNFDYLCNKYGLSNREQDIVRLLMKGMLHKEIASYVHLSLRGVEYQISKIYKKCGVKNQSGLLKKFVP